MRIMKACRAAGLPLFGRIARLRFPVVLALLMFAQGHCVAQEVNGSRDSSKVSLVATQAGTLQLHAIAARWNDVFEELSAFGGFQIHHEGMPRDPVSLTCEARNYEAMFNCLLGGGVELLMFVYPPAESADGADRVPLEIWIGRAAVPSGPSAQAGAEVPATPQVPASDPEANHRRVRRDPAAAGAASAMELMELAASGDPAQRARSLSRLATAGQPGDERVGATLKAALGDADAAVRSHAIAGLVRRDEPGLVAVLENALSDPDPAVRLSALEGVSLDAENLNLLRRAQADSDETVRSLAATKLQLMDEMARRRAVNGSNEPVQVVKRRRP